MSNATMIRRNICYKLVESEAVGEVGFLFYVVTKLKTQSNSENEVFSPYLCLNIEPMVRRGGGVGGVGSSSILNPDYLSIYFCCQAGVSSHDLAGTEPEDGDPRPSEGRSEEDERGGRARRKSVSFQPLKNKHNNTGSKVFVRILFYIT